MKKRIYRAVEIKDLVEHGLASAVEGERVVVGIDVAKNKQFAVIAVGTAKVVNTIKWNHPEETPRFIDLLKQLPCESVEVALEPTGTYGDAMRYQMLNRGLKVFRVSAKKVKDAREVYDGVPSSHDAKAAAIVAKLHVDGASEPWALKTDDERALVADLALMCVFDRQVQYDINLLEAHLARHWPEVQRLLELKSMTLLTLLSTYGGPGPIAEDRKQAKILMGKASKSSLKKEKLEAVVASAEVTVGVPQVEAEIELLKALAKDALRALRSSLKAKSCIEEQVKQIPEVVAMGAVIGKPSAAVLATKVGSPLSFPTAKAYEKSCGLNVKEQSSGSHRGGLRITKRGSGAARRYLYLAVLRLIQRDPVMRAWYDKKVARDGGKAKGKAIVALMRKLIRALWHVARGNPFDSTLLFDITRLEFAVTR